jgi:hypothetical protein
MVYPRSELTTGPEIFAEEGKYQKVSPLAGTEVSGRQ